MKTGDYWLERQQHQHHAAACFMLAAGAGNCISLVGSILQLILPVTNLSIEQYFTQRQDGSAACHAAVCSSSPPEENCICITSQFSTAKENSRGSPDTPFQARGVRDHLQTRGSSPISSSRPIKQRRKQIKSMTQSVASPPLIHLTHSRLQASDKGNTEHSSSRKRQAANNNANEKTNLSRITKSRTTKTPMTITSLVQKNLVLNNDIGSWKERKSRAV